MLLPVVITEKTIIGVISGAVFSYQSYFILPGRIHTKANDFIDNF